MAWNRRPFGQRGRSSYGGADEEMAELEALLAGDSDPGPGAAWRSRIVGWGGDKGRRARGRELQVAGAVRALRVETGRIVAEVVGTSQVYQVQVVVRPPSRWEIEAMRRELQTPAIARNPGALTNDALLMLDALVRTMVVTCTCLDGWGCKHAIAALLAFGPRLDAEPTVLLTLWGVAGAPGAAEAMAEPRFTLLPLAPGKVALTGDLGELFGIDLITATEP